MRGDVLCWVLAEVGWVRISGCHGVKTQCMKLPAATAILAAVQAAAEYDSYRTHAWVFLLVSGGLESIVFGSMVCLVVSTWHCLVYGPYKSFCGCNTFNVCLLFRCWRKQTVPFGAAVNCLCKELLCCLAGGISSIAGLACRCTLNGK